MQDLREGVLDRSVGFAVRVDQLLQEHERELVFLVHIVLAGQHVVQTTEIRALGSVQAPDRFHTLKVRLLRHHRRDIEYHSMALGAQPIRFEVGLLGAVEFLVARNVERRESLPRLVICAYTINIITAKQLVTGVATWNPNSHKEDMNLDRLVPLTRGRPVRHRRG